VRPTPRSSPAPAAVTIRPSRRCGTRRLLPPVHRPIHGASARATPELESAAESGCDLDRATPGPGEATGNLDRIEALRIAIDGTPLLGHRTGVGEVTAGLLGALAPRAGLELHAYALTWRGRTALSAVVPPGVRTATRPIPANVVREFWCRGLARPRAEDWTGPVDVVHATNFVAPPARAPVVVTVHDVTFVRFPELCTEDTLRYPALLQRAIDRGATVHTPSEFVAAEVRDHFRVDPDRVVAIHSGVPAIAPGDARRGRHLAGHDRYVLALGTVEPRKNLTTLVRAFDRLAADDPDLGLVLAGPPGWDSARVQATIDTTDARERVVQTGFVADADRADLLAGALVFAYPSVYEGFGFPPLEAMQRGVPVVAGNAGALPEVLGDAARLVEPHDVEALAAALAELADPVATARAALVERGRAQAARYDWATTADRMVALYRGLA
jgi:glycosyltransferase involved in cell wall biosynthesis